MDDHALIYKILKTENVVITAISGGDVNAVYRIKYRENDHFIKLNHAKKYPEMLHLEAKGLSELKEKGSFKIPEIIDEGIVDDFQYLILTYIQPELKTAPFWQLFGENLAKQHKSSHSSFGLNFNNYIGSLSQVNQPTSTWEEFIITQRFIPQLKLATDSSTIEKQERKRIEAIFPFCQELWPKEPPALLHGDLWSGNYLSGSEPYLIDPAIYYGHREMDLGMMHLFGGFNESVYMHYQEIYPLERGWEQRIGYNQLYPLLVHLNLFGRSYLSQLLNIVKSFS